MSTLAAKRERWHRRCGGGGQRVEETERQPTAVVCGHVQSLRTARGHWRRSTPTAAAARPAPPRGVPFRFESVGRIEHGTANRSVTSILVTSLSLRSRFANRARPSSLYSKPIETLVMERPQLGTDSTVDSSSPLELMNPVSFYLVADCIVYRIVSMTRAGSIQKDL